jgi:hypothetical protein
MNIRRSIDTYSIVDLLELLGYAVAPPVLYALHTGVGRTVSHYRIVSLLGGGGMASCIAQKTSGGGAM